MPSDIAGQLSHTIPEINGVAGSSAPSPLTLANLNSLNGEGNGGVNVYLTSKEGIQALPSWLHGITPGPSHQTDGGTTCAIITVDKGNGMLDAFYFYFYAYNQGDWVFNLPSLEFGDHVGDWEHNMIRFQNGEPQAVWYSQHADGEAFTYAAVQKQGIRPLTFVANGTHADYATSGAHDHTIPDVNLPGGPLEDHCDEGTLWDPTLAAYGYSYANTSNTFTAYSGSASPNWLYFEGHWGDAQLPDSTPGQVDIFGQQKYVAGPTGPIDKVLYRTAVCPDANNCIVRPILTV
jgi:hypothetical protein